MRATQPLISRRHALAGSAALATTVWIGRYGRARAGAGYPFSLGIASGSPIADGVVLWTRLAPDPLQADGSGGIRGVVPVTWEVAADDAMQKVVQRGSIEADARWAHSVHVEVGNLEPNRPYWYRFMALGQVSPIGATRTLPRPDDAVQSFRVAFASCSHYEFGYFSAYRHMAEEKPDLVLFLGDYIYEYTVPADYADQTVRRHNGPTATDLIGYRNRYALYRTDPDLQALHAAAPCMTTWDDHEVENDYANEWSQDVHVSPEDFLRRRTAAYQAYYEHMPLRAGAHPTGTGIRLYDRVHYGRLATFTLLDGRQYRSKQPCEQPTSRRGHVETDTCTERLDPRRSLLGLEQEQWLYEGFRQSQSSWTILAQAQLMAQLRQKGASGELGHWTDGWDGYAASRDRLLEAIAKERVLNPVVIGGDIHSFWATDLKANFNNPSSPTIATELVGTSITSNGPPYQRFVEMLPENPHVRFFDSRHRGYMVIDLASGLLDARFRVISDRRDRSASVSTLKRFVVESGKPGVVES